MSKKSVVGLYSKDLMYYELGDPDRALEIINHLLYLEPDDIFSLILKLIIYRKQGSPQTAMKICKRIIEIDEKNALAWANMAWLYYTENQYEKVIEAAKKSLNIDPDNADANAYALFYGSKAAKKTENLNLASEWEEKLSDLNVKKIIREKDLQTKLIKEPWRIEKVLGKDIKFKEKEYALKDRKRIDLLYKSIITGDFIIFELKVVPATSKTYKQITGYMDAIKTIEPEKNVKGIVLSLGYDKTFKNLIDKNPHVSQMDFRKLGLEV
ncbi:tetratricopeptide repeat protein [Methanobacterium spitsbergense]|uniref:Tetratricopeptide repeat protein n=1 Tax=Methanobacterium spitsbergense TaxID=2874285 RepID=A0A8T5UYU0_9EURY|nr:tetratricopeptide repeat protein [Methanobacterium spitsbergense]MBZ2165899.1 tetratricopeptide repeat protein [Methanobacterium spitsbergense]